MTDEGTSAGTSAGITGGPAGSEHAVPPPDQDVAERAAQRLAGLATPPGALGRLGELAVWWAAVRGEPVPTPPRRVELHVVCGDHGVVERGVSAFPASVTPLMVRAVADGGAAVCALARQHGVHVAVHDLAVDGPWDGSGAVGDERVLPAAVLVGKVRRGSRSLDTDDALDPGELARALASGRHVADTAIDRGTELLVLGDLGIGNTTPAAALVAAVLGLDAVAVAGRGTGVDDTGLARKRAAIDAGLARVRAGSPSSGDPAALLGRLGGADLAAMAGICLQAARRRTPVLLDGVVTTAPALVAEQVAPGTRAWLLAGHRSTEPAHGLALEALGLEPLLTLGMRLGEGSGALAALPLLRSAAALLAETTLLADVLGG